MGNLKYEFKNRIHMFAKANIKFEKNSTLGLQYEVYNIYYDRKLFIYPFMEQKIPDYISIVPLVDEVNSINIEELNKLYNNYSEIQVKRNVEGFIIIFNSESIQKYVRMKSGALEEHFWRE